MKTILVVDDDSYTLKLFERLFRGKSFALTLTASGSEAKRLYEKNNFNLILMDQRLPDADGIELLEWMRQERPQQVAILMTGFPDVRKSGEALRKGLFAILAKPFKNLEALETLIEKGLELDQVYREINHLRDVLAQPASHSEVIGVDQRAEPGARAEEALAPYKEEMETFETSYLKRLLELSDGDILEAARLSGITPKNIQLRIKQYGL